MASSIRARLSRLEARFGLARGELCGDGPAGALVKLYQAGCKAPALTAAESVAVGRGAAVIWIPHNGRDPLSVPRSCR